MRTNFVSDIETQLAALLKVKRLVVMFKATGILSN